MDRPEPAATYHDTPIAGTTVFTGSCSQQGYRVNKFAMSLTNPANRESFRADERGYMATYGLTEPEMQLVERRDWAGLIAAGGNVYLLLKIAGSVGQNLLQMGAQMRGEPLETFLQTRPGTSASSGQRRS